MVKQLKEKKNKKEAIRVLTEEHKKAFLAIVENKVRLKLDSEALRDDIKALSEKLGIGTGEVGEIVNLIMKEKEKGGALQSKSNTLDLAEQVVGTSSSVDK